MSIENVITVIDEEISKLKQARELLSGTPDVLPTVKRGPKLGSKNKMAVASESSKVPMKAKRAMSAVGKARIAAAQKARWAASKAVPAEAKATAKNSAKTPAKKTVGTASKKAIKVTAKKTTTTPVKSADYTTA